MSFVLNNQSSGKKELLEPDYYLARCYAVVITGTSFNQTFGNTQTKVTFLWELPSVLINFEKDGETVTAPKTISKSFTLSMNERATLRKNLESWIDRSFTEDELRDGVDISKFCGTPCRLSIGQGQKQDGTKYNSVDKVVRMKSDDKCPKLFNEKILFDITDPEQDLSVLDKLPAWIAETVRKSDEYQKRIYGDEEEEEVAPLEYDEADLPF